MSDDVNAPKSSIKDAFKPGEKSATKKGPVLFTADEMDIYCNKITKEAFIFHAKTINYDELERMEYNHKDYSVTVIKKDGTSLDLGVKIQWLIRPYFSKAEEVQIVQTKDGAAVNGTFLPLIHKGK
jgi:hypothetical protein